LSNNFFKLKIVLHWCTSHGYKLCSFCTNYAFKYDSDRIQHELQHIPFGCSNCSHEFTSINETNISEHYKEAHQSFLCSYCSSVIQPFSKYPEHVEKKHSVINYVEFSRNNKLFSLDSDEEVNRDSFFNCLMCNKRKRIDLLFGHYVFYHNISIHSLKKFLHKVPEISINGSVLSADDRESGAAEIEETGNNLKDMCSVCENPFKFDEIAKELHSVFCQGYIVCNLKDCAQVFENKNELSQHLHSKHSSLSCKYGCKESTLLNPQEINDHMQNLHDIVECFLCNIVNSSGNFKNHLRDKHSVNLLTYEKAMNTTTSKLYRVENSPDDSKQVLCNFCDHDLTDEIKEFSFINHYQNEHEISSIEILRNLDKNPIIDVILDDKKSKIDEECLSNFSIIKSLDRLIETDFDTSKVWCIGIEHIEEKPVLDEDDEILKAILKCEFCNSSFVDNCVYYEHLKDYHGFKLINLDSCDKCKIQNSETLVNEDNKNFNLALICPLDSSYHVTKDNFKNHMIYEHFDKNLTSDSVFYKCYVCSFAYKNLKEVRAHFNESHPDVKMNYCKLCRYRLTSSENVDHFARNHAEDLKRVEKFCCNLCKKEFKKMGTAKMHFVNSHRKKDLKKKSSFKCQFTLCNKVFDNKEDRKMHHIFAHPDEKMFTCKSCPLKFSTKSSLSSHNIIHKNVVNTCEFCSKTFLRRDSFKEHLLIHSDTRLKCSFCEKLFVQRSNLVRHERIHLQEKPYQCTFEGCGKTFSDKGACTSHEKVHTKEESSNCEVCGKHFARKQKLKYHMRFDSQT